MNGYHIAVVLPCQECQDNKHYYKKILRNLYTQLECVNEEELLQTEHDELPLLLFNHCINQLFNLVVPKIKFIEAKEYVNEVGCQEKWINLLNNPTDDIDFKTLLGRLEEFLSNECYVKDTEKSVENVAEQLHNIADDLPCTGLKLNIYWMICEHGECVNISNNIPLYGAFKRLQMWNSACITCIYDLEEEFSRNNFDSWHEGLDISLENICQITLLVNPNIVWCGSITLLKDQPITKNLHVNDWNLSIENTSMSLLQSRSYVKRFDLSLLSRNRGSKVKVSQDMLRNNITIICEIASCDIPSWKMLPYKFNLYHNTLVKRVFEIEKLPKVYEKLPELDKHEKGNVLLASMKSHRNITPSLRTTMDWVEFVETGHLTDDPGITDQVNSKTTETFYLLLYPVEPGIFDVFFTRPENSLCNLHSMLAVHKATFLHTKSNQTLSVALETSHERQWLKQLDNKCGVAASPFKSQLSLAVHLDASEMLKHFTKDGKPLKKELEALRKQIEEKSNNSPTKRKLETSCASEVGIDYCTNSVPSQRSFSPKLLPKHVKHETLSLCNTPKTLAKAKLQGTKRKAESDKTTEEVTVGDQPSSSNQLITSNSKPKKAKLSSGSPSALPNKISKSQTSKETKQTIKIDSSDDPTVSTEPSEETNVKKKKRRSFDGSETSLAQAVANADTKEKRSERHRRRLARVVKRALSKYGVDSKADHFKTCSERLYYLCKSFLKDLKTSEGLNNEMKRLAESNVANVVEFEKRQRAKGKT